MTDQTLITTLKHALAQPLPGWERQQLMAPENRRTDISRMGLARDDYRESSVLLLLYPDEAGQLHFVLTKRPEYDGVHSGQISFPGGRKEPGEQPQETALREAREEIGVPAAQITVLGQLSRLYIPPSNFMVYPFVGFCPARPAFKPSPREVAQIIEPPLALLFDEATCCEEYRQFPQIGRARIPYLNLLGHKVWGATAMILSEFAAIVEKHLNHCEL
jgi:8-oxo-dGTP pyrophosphatase MutT (NUDIX family)